MNICILLSGGVGTRLHSDIPKQYIKVEGRMIIDYTLDVICEHEDIDAVYIVADSAWHDDIRRGREEDNKIKGFALPGKNRQLSIYNALTMLRDSGVNDSDVVIIHDAVRPLVSAGMISEVLREAGRSDGAVPVLPLKDTVYDSADGKRLTGLIERSRLLAGQAPEAFVYGKYMAANEALLPDDIMHISGSAQPAIMYGMDIVSVEGDEANFKITTNSDLERFIRIIEESR